MRPNQQGTPSEAKSPIRLTASLATVPAVRADTRAALLRMIRFSRWLAIRGCARSSLQAALNWKRRTGEEIYRAGRCRIRKSPTLLPGSQHTVFLTPGSLTLLRITRSIRSLTMSNENLVSRRGFFMNMRILFNGFLGAALTVPIVGYLLSCITRGRANAYLSWVPLGPVSEFPEGETRLATFRNPYVTPTDGKTADTACWVRRIEGEQFQVFAVNCAHLGCPVRWFQQSNLFMCPCHGGAYYQDGSRASGPPERGLFQYPYKVQDGLVTIQAGELPTPGVSASLAGKKPSCA